MFTEDFILRLIRQMSIVLAGALGRKAAGEYREAVDAIDRFLEEVVGLDAALVHAMDDESLLAALSPQGNLDIDRLLIVGDMLKEQAEILDAQELPEEAAVRRMRALNFYLEAALTGAAQVPPAPFDRLETLLERFAGQALPFQTTYNLAQYAEGLGQYARAEGYLRSLVGTPGTEAQVEAELADFYQRILDQSDIDLERGGLTRTQIQSRLGL